MESRRTTVILDRDLYRQAKRMAVERETSLKEVIQEALRTFLRVGPQPAPPEKRSRFGAYRGRATGDLRRTTMYRDIRK